MSQSLLPSGFYDLLPPDAAREQRILSALLSAYECFGFQFVTPPLAEFEDSLLDGKGRAYETQTFRIMDPLSRHMMGIRADITTQIARIAVTQLGKMPRPLRLAYAGRVLRTQPDSLNPARQHVQCGFEIIGSEDTAGLKEALLVTLNALTAVGCRSLVIDISLAGLLQKLTKDASSEHTRTIMDAVRQKDISALPAGKHTQLIANLMQLPGEFAEVLMSVESAGFPDGATPWLEEINALEPLCNSLPLQIDIRFDPLETRGFEYHEGPCFTVFDKEHRREIGRGGRYIIDGMSDTEIAYGATMYTRTLMECGYMQQDEKLAVLINSDAPLEEFQSLWNKNYRTVIAHTKDMNAEARHTGCLYYWLNGKLNEVT
jgi:ATP phosphoribosyltransferase regulatory subunit